MFSLKKVFSFTVVLALLFVACVPEDGEEGPVGPVGPEGAIGPAGEDGKDGVIGRDGTDGADGTDGVNGKAETSVMDYTIIGTDWAVGRASRQFVDITQKVIDGGAVQVFRETTTASFPDVVWTALPAEPFGFAIKTDSIVFLTPGFSGANFASTFRVVVIPPADKIVGFEPNSYEELKMVYGLED